MNVTIRPETYMPFPFLPCHLLCCRKCLIAPSRGSELCSCCSTCLEYPSLYLLTRWFLFVLQISPHLREQPPVPHHNPVFILVRMTSGEHPVCPSSPELDVIKGMRAFSFGRGRLQCQYFLLGAFLWEHSFTYFLIDRVGLVLPHLQGSCEDPRRTPEKHPLHPPRTWQTGGTWEISGAFPSSTGGVRAAPDESSEKCLDGGANRPHLKGRFIPWECQDVWPWASRWPSQGRPVLRVTCVRGEPRTEGPLGDGWFVEPTI